MLEAEKAREAARQKALLEKHDTENQLQAIRQQEEDSRTLGELGLTEKEIEAEIAKRKERTDRYAGVSGKRPPKTEAERLAELNKQIDAESLAMIEAQRAKERAESESLETERGENKTKY